MARPTRSGVTVQSEMTVGIYAPPMGMIMQHAEGERDQDHEGEERARSRMQNQSNGDHQGAGEQQKIDQVLALVSQRTLRQEFSWSLPAAIRLPRHGQPPESPSSRQHRHHERRRYRAERR